MLRNYIFATGLLLSGAASLAAAAEAGRVVFVTGHAELANRAAALDAAVQEGDELATGADGYVYIKTVDSGFLILRPNSKARIVAYQIDKANPANTRVKLELSQGVARAISGQGVKQARQNFRFNTPVAAIGVRGTDFIVFTDQKTSRVAVVSGGVVVSGFDGACRAEGSGPCEGSTSRELFAGQAGMLLQVERGQKAPQLLNNPSLSPDQNEKPRSDEPVGKVAAASLAPTQVNLDPQKSAQSLEAVKAVVTPKTDIDTNTAKPPVVVTPPVIVTPPVVPVEPLKPNPPEIFWGRWKEVAGVTEVDPRLKEHDVVSPTFVGAYAIARLKDTGLVMPKEGLASFKLTGGDAIIQKTGEADMAAAVENGRLNMDFAARRFTTGVTVVGGSDRIDVSGTGSISDKGELSNDFMTNTKIQGYIGGSRAEQAGYIFKNTSRAGMTVMGATSWSR
ncbi:FecR domain-containing protein [Massilia sp. BJB1822]|uniref:FecR family protein n=1 Tax=Massilia sp. BJB1822 TaxID=2744470 RepID=UPI001593E9BB|nr:FecR family protein [Massilia sp. BJB1822]NVE01396.1 FecR domain-containing protein [Massilia sp. BJB1822]